MKTITFCFMSMILLMDSCIGGAPYSEKEISRVEQSQAMSLKSIRQNDTLLNNIQQKILNAFVEAKIRQTDDPLVSLEQILFGLNERSSNNIIIYWYSYACYYHSILFMIRQDNKKSEQVLDAGIDKLNEVNSKTSEHLALLALMEGFAIQYAPGIEVPSISKRIKQNTDKALQLDSTNLRVYYVIGSNDFYTPEQYGGGKKAEMYLKKAISLPDQSVKNPYLPSWGKNSAYEMLVRLYINHEQYDEAKKYYQEAITLFPDDYMINKLAGELIKY